jgi:5-methyltetrahydrofolate--homocysteine methyltransferase
MMANIKAFEVLSNIDKGAEEFIKFMSESEADKKNNNRKAEEDHGSDLDLKSIIIKGIKKEAAQLTKELLKENDALDIVNKYLIPALDIVGERYEKGKIFLPQLVQSAETVKEAFTVLKEQMAVSGGRDIFKGKIVMATVKGDVHDIGKNIVKTVLENYGYEIIDLGRNAAVKDVAAAVKDHDIELLGLSALMTTTVKNMEKTIKKVKEESPECKIMVGGAVLTSDYADMINADYYARDAKEAVEIASEVFKEEN